MILALDVQYVLSSAYVAGVMFELWESEVPQSEYISYVKHVKAYEPGRFYKRELPCLLSLLDQHNIEVECIVIDGYVYLDEQQKPGLGKYLYDSLQEKVEIIGVAKKPFAGIGSKHEVLRGSSKKPLFVTTTGRLEYAKGCISQMYGEYRIPTLLKRADQLCREKALVND